MDEKGDNEETASNLNGEIKEEIGEGENRILNEFLPNQIDSVEIGLQIPDSSQNKTQEIQETQINSAKNNSESSQNRTQEIQETVNLREIAKDLKKIKKQNFITHCLLSVLIVVTLTWQCGEVSVLLSVKNKVTNPVKMVKDLIKDKIVNGKGNKSAVEGLSLPTISLTEKSQGDLQLFSLSGAK